MAELVSILEQVVQPVLLCLLSFGQNIQHERLLIGRVRVIEVTRGDELADEELLAALKRVAANLKAGLLRFGQRKHHISGQVHVALLAIGPPAPAAILALLIVQVVQPLLDQSWQSFLQLWIANPQLLQRAIGQDIRQEPAHGLLGALVLVMLKIFQPVLHRRRERRVKLNRKLALAVVVLRRQRDDFGAPARRGQVARRAHNVGRRVSKDEQRSIRAGGEARLAGVAVFFGHHPKDEFGLRHVFD